MIVKKVHLENWAIFREPIEVEFSNGLNILHGPNDIGKSTLVDSIRIVFFTKHTSHSEKVRSLIPWGSTLSPKATITFFQNGAYYRMTKRFISSEMSLLERLIDDKWTRIAEGDDADKKVIELVGGKLPTRGDTKPEFWGTGQALWMVQGEPFISEDLNEETLSSLQKLIGAAIETDQEKDMFRRINERFSSIFTDVRRELKKGSEIKNLEEKIGELEESKRKADSDRQEKEELIRKIDDKEIILLNEKEKLKKKVEEANEHRRNREKLEEEIKRIASECEALKRQIDGIKEGNRKIKDIELENHSLNEEKNEYQNKLEKLQKKIDKINERFNKLREDIDLNDDALRYARIAYDTIQKGRELKEKEELLNEVKELENELSKKQRDAERFKAPSEKEIDQIERNHQQIHDIKTKLDAIGLTTKIMAKSEVSGKIYLDGKSFVLKLEKGKQNTWTSHQTVKIQIDKIGDIEIKSGSEDVREMKARLEKLEIDYEKAVAPYATKDLKKLKELSHQKGDLKREIKRLKRELKRRAKDGKEAIEREIAGLKKKVKSNWGKIPEDSEFRKYERYKEKTTAQKELSEKINELEKILKKLKKEQKDFESNSSKLEKERNGIKSEIQKLEKKIHGNSERIKEIRTNLEKLQEDGLSIKKRESKLNKNSLELDKKERALEEYKNKIKEAEEKPLKAWEECETSIERFQNDRGKLKEDIAEMNGKLITILKDLKDINKTEEELEYLKKRKQQLLIDARAIELLYNLMHFYRGKTIETLTIPIQKMMAEDLRILFGEKYTSVRFDNGVKPASVEVPIWGINASIDVLSFGTKEQIWYLFRLALGRSLSSEERQLVVLDDPLANTDLSRMHRALQILKERANELQIIIITCDVDKYNWLSNANFISVER